MKDLGVNLHDFVDMVYLLSALSLDDCLAERSLNCPALLREVPVNQVLVAHQHDGTQ